MIDYSEIEKTLIESEANYDTSFAALSKLAPLYCALLYKQMYGRADRIQAEPLNVSGDSEFLQAVDGENNVAIFAILDELMTTLQTIQPRLYDAVLRKLQTVE